MLRFSYAMQKGNHFLAFFGAEIIGLVLVECWLVLSFDGKNQDLCT